MRRRVTYGKRKTKDEGGGGEEEGEKEDGEGKTSIKTVNRK